jgi:hypothetical protein
MRKMRVEWAYHCHMRVPLLSLVFLGAACASTPPPQSTATTQSDMMRGACQVNAQRLLAMCTAMPSPPPNGSSEQLRRGVESQRTACPADVLAPVDRCVTRLEHAALAQDPDAPTRRAAAKGKAESVKQRPEFKKMIDEWLQAYDGGRIVCRQAKASPSHARECERWNKDLGDVEDRLRAYLVKEGFDVRDVRELGLWPSSPDGPYG